MAVPVAGDMARVIGIRGIRLGRRAYRERESTASSSLSIIVWMSSRTRSRKPVSIGSNQSSRRWTAVSACEP